MNLATLIEFSEIKSRISSHCKTSSAREMVENIDFLTDYDKINYLLNLSLEMRNILLSLKDFPSDGYIDMRKTLSQLSISDSVIELEDMPLLYKSLTAIKQITSFLYSYHASNNTLISKMMNNLCHEETLKHNLPNILNNLATIIDEKGEIRENCSPKIREIKYNQRNIEAQIQRTISKILLNSKKEGWSKEDDEISIRNGSLVVPVKASYKRQIRGILHDSSSTGQTLFIEPSEIVDFNFEIKELDLLLKREIHRILLGFSNLLRESLYSIVSLYDFLVEIDFLRAKAIYAIETNALKPEISSKPMLDWYDAKHPLLEASLKRKRKEIVPLRIYLNDKNRILVISGPNAGGKSVCLKTVAMLQYMLQCGLLVPMKEVSRCGVFDKIFLSIGDEQSIENDLSTYSSHLMNMKELCNQADRNTLFLIDEFGTGTDPLIGGAIAESILEYLNEVKSYGIVTTHYSVLKHLAYEKEGIENAAMLFDTKKLLPLYVLNIGTAGSSFAFEMAAKAGLNKRIIENAKKKIGKKNISFEESLGQIAVNKLETEKTLKQAQEYDNILFETVNKYKSLLSQIELSRRKILDDAKKEAKTILLDANRQIEHTIEEIKTHNADKNIVKKLRKEVASSIKNLDENKVTDYSNKVPLYENKVADYSNEATLYSAKSTKPKYEKVNSPIEVGDYVIFYGSDNVGKVENINKNEYEVSIGEVKIKTKKQNLYKIDKRSYLKQLKNSVSQSNHNISAANISIMDKLNEERLQFSEQIDVRGMRVADALEATEKQLDKAKMLGEKHIKILHGKGDGILKVAIRDYLSKTNDVKAFHAQSVEFGGEGITEVELED